MKILLSLTDSEMLHRRRSFYSGAEDRLQSGHHRDAPSARWSSSASCSRARASSVNLSCSSSCFCSSSFISWLWRKDSRISSVWVNRACSSCRREEETYHSWWKTTLALEKDERRAAAVIYFTNCLNRCRELYSCTTAEGNRELVLLWNHIMSNLVFLGIIF